MNATATTATPSATSTSIVLARLQSFTSHLRAIAQGPRRADMRDLDAELAVAAWNYVVELDARPTFGRVPAELDAWYDCRRLTCQVLDLCRAEAGW